MQKAFLHLGLAKTGTTSLQTFFRANRGVLAAEGVIYPDTTGRNIGNGTPAALTMAGPLPEYFLFYNPEYAAQPPTFDQLWKALIEAAQPGKALLISSEEIPELDIRAFRHATRGDGLDTHVFLYLRRQDLALESTYTNLVRFGLQAMQFDEFVRLLTNRKGPPARRHAYADLLQLLVECYGGDRVMLRIFDEPTDPTWIFRSTLELLGLHLHEGYEVPTPRNTGSHPLVVEYIRRATLRGEFSPSLGSAANKAAEASRLTDGIPRGLFSPEARARLLAGFEDDNRWISDEFFFGEQPLFSSTSRLAEPLFVPSMFEPQFRQLHEMCRDLLG